MRKDPPKIDWPYVFSASQIETFLLCPRKWAYDKIDGIEDPGNESSELGGLVHEQLENYLGKGIPIQASTKEGKIAMSGLPHLPPPLYPGMQIEDWFHIKIGGAYVRGLKDVQIKEGWQSKNPFVSDHKTTKNFIWAKSEDYLSGKSGIGDIQACIYAYDTILDTGKEEVDLQWTYLRTTGANAAKPIRTTTNIDILTPTLVHIENTIDQMIQIKMKHPTSEGVRQNPKGCEAFGGCFGKELCRLTPQQKLRAIMSQKVTEEKNSVLAKLARRKAEKEGGTAPAKETAPVETKTETVEVNPPENAMASEPPLEEAKAEPAKEEKPAKTTSVKARSNKQTLSNAGTPQTPVATAEAPPAHGSRRTLSRAFDAFFDVIVQDIADAVGEKLKK